jgi:hypothetical protein
MDASGDLYGITADGRANLIRTVFNVTPTGQELVLGGFGTSDLGGSPPFAGLIMDKSGNFYGTTSFGGLYSDLSTALGGTVFVLTPTGQGTDLWNFNNGTDGASPFDASLLDANGNLFGTTSAVVFIMLV